MKKIMILIAATLFVLPSVSLAQEGYKGGSKKSTKGYGVMGTRDKNDGMKKGGGRLRHADLTAEEKDILLDGETGMGFYIVGGVVGSIYGLGIGHGIQGRYSSKGWIFTVGEVGSILVFVSSLTNCVNGGGLFSSSRCDTNGLFGLSVASYVGFRVWEIVDLWVTPMRNNKKYRRLKQLTGDDYPRAYIYPGKSSPMLGLAYRF